MKQSPSSAGATTHDAPATIAWSATETAAYSEAPFSDEAFCIQLMILNGERHVYRLRREALVQLFSCISDVLAKTSIPSNKDGAMAA